MANIADQLNPDIQMRREFRGQLLKWYDRHGRDLPWRVKSEAKPDSYKIWLSEVMLQQTTVQAVMPYYRRFLALWPSVHDLAKADPEHVMKEWAGLGYYARARNLIKCAKIVSNDHGGVFPQSQENLKHLPGIGEYTSAAIAAIASGQCTNVVDGNVERVMARIFAFDRPLRGMKPVLKDKAAEFCFEDMGRHADYPQALMDLGATICTPKNPLCVLCPVNDHCLAYQRGAQHEIPVKVVKKKLPHKKGFVFIISDEKGEYLLEKRSEKAMLGNMMGFPCSEWNEGDLVDWGDDALFKQLQPLEALADMSQSVRHVFTHFSLELYPVFIMISSDVNEKRIGLNYRKSCIVDFEEIGFPTLFRKVWKNMIK